MYLQRLAIAYYLYWRGLEHEDLDLVEEACRLAVDTWTDLYQVTRVFPEDALPQLPPSVDVSSTVRDLVVSSVSSWKSDRARELADIGVVLAEDFAAAARMWRARKRILLLAAKRLLEVFPRPCVILYSTGQLQRASQL